MLKYKEFLLISVLLCLFSCCKTDKRESEIVLFGDSMMEEWYKCSPDFFKENNLSCEGKGGQVSRQILSRFKRYLFYWGIPNTILINAGTNDVAGNEGLFDQGKTMGNIKTMVEIAKENNIKVILSSVLPSREYHWNTSVVNTAGKIEELNSAIRKYAEENGLMYVDFHSKMKTDEGGMLPNLADDGSHPNLAGYRVMESVLTETLSRK